MLCSALGMGLDSWQFWAFVTLMWCIEQNGRADGVAENTRMMIIVLKSMGVDINRLLKEMKNDIK